MEDFDRYGVPTSLIRQAGPQISQFLDQMLILLIMGLVLVEVRFLESS